MSVGVRLVWVIDGFLGPGELQAGVSGNYTFLFEVFLAFCNAIIKP